MAGGFASRLVCLTGLTQHCKQCTSVVLCMNQQLLCIPSSAVILNIHVTCSQKISKSKKYHCLLPGWSQHPSLTRVILCLPSMRGNYIPLAQGVKSLSALGWQGVTIMIRGNAAQMMLLLLSLYIGNFAACLNTRIITHTTKEMSNRFPPSGRSGCLFYSTGEKAVTGAHHSSAQCEVIFSTFANMNPLGWWHKRFTA